MAWIQDQTYSFTIARLVEGFLRIDSLTVNAVNMIIGGVDQGVTPLIHPGDTVNVSMVISNQGDATDDFLIRAYKNATLYYTSPIFANLIIGGTASFSPASFVMPDANVDIEIRTFHRE